MSFGFSMAGIVALAVALLLSGSTAEAVNYVLTNTSGGNWSTPTLWTPNGIPGSAPLDSVAINLAGGPYTVVMDYNMPNPLTGFSIGACGVCSPTLNITTGTLRLGAGTYPIDAGGTVLLSPPNGQIILGGGNFDVLSGGTFTLNGVFNGSGVINVYNGSTAAITGGAIQGPNMNIVFGSTVTYTPGGTFILGTGSQLTNNGTFTVNGDGTIASGSGSPVFTNNGTFQKTGGIGQLMIQGPMTFNNASGASLLINSGKVTFWTTAAPNSGQTSIAAGSALEIFGVYSFETGATAVLGTGDVKLLNGGTLTINTSISVPKLTLDPGTVTGPSPHVLTAGTLNWARGFMTGTGTTSVTGNTTSSTGGTATLDARTFNSAGTFTTGCCGFTITNGATFNNSGTFIYALPLGLAIRNGSTINNSGLMTTASTSGISSSGVPSSINNSGTFQKTGAGDLTVTPGIVLNNLIAGTIDVQGGSAYLEGTISAGAFAIAPTARLELGGVTTLNAGATVTGGGPLDVIATLTVSTNVTVPNVVLQGTINGASPNVLTVGTLNWSGGTMSGSGTTTVTGATTMASPFPTTLSRTFNNQGTFSFNPAPGVSFNMTAGAIFNNTGTANMTSAGATFGAGGGTFNNIGPSGLVVVNTTTFTFNPNIFNNQNGAIFRSSTGALAFSPATANSAGEFNITGGRLDFFGPATNLNPGATVTGIGQFNVYGGTVTVNTSLTIPNLVISAGTLTGPTPHVVTANQLTWGTGTISGNGTINVVGPGTSTFQFGLGPGGGTLDTRTINLSGVLIDYANNNGLNMANGATINISSTGQYAADAALTRSFTGSGSINNSGTFFVTGGTGAITVPAGISFANSTGGMGLNVQGGSTLVLQGPFTNSAAAIFVDAASTLSSMNPILLGGGTLSGFGTVVGNVTNDGNVNPGTSPGALLISGNYAQTSTGSLNIQLAGNTPANYDQLNVSGSVTLDGTLNVDTSAYTPVGGDTFNIMNFGSRPGPTDFAVKNGLPGPGAPLTANYTATALNLTAAIVAAPADLGVTKSAAPSPAPDGQNITYTVTVTNNGPGAATGVTMTDTLPAGVAFVSASSSVGSCSPSAGIVMCTIGALGVSSSATITIVVTPSGGPGTYVNSATVSGAEPDPTPANDSVTISTIVVPAADLSITKTDSPDPVPAAGTLTYTLTVSNTGPSLASAPITVTDTIPAGTTLQSITAPGWSCAGTTTITCTQPALLASSTAPAITIVVTAPSTGGTISNTASVTSPTPDPNTANNSATQPTIVLATADLAIAKTGPATATAGQTITYTITVTNNGPSAVSSVNVSDPTPAGLTFVSNTGACTTAFPCVIASLAPTQSVTITSTYAISGGASGVISNTAAVSAAGAADPNVTNNNATLATTIVQSADVALTKTGPSTVAPGQNVTYVVTLTNAGPSDASAVVVNDPTPAGLTFVSNSGACTTSYPCNLGTMTAGSTATITTIYNVPLAFPSASFSNTASATSSTPDPVGGNNSATATTTVSTSADMQITKTAQSAAPTRTITFTISIRNAGPSSALNVIVDDPTPTGLTFVSNTGDCTTPFPCGFGTLAPNARKTIVATYNIGAGVTTISNTAMVSSTSGDPVPSNNSATATVRNNLCPVDSPTQVVPSEGSTDAPLEGSIFWTNVGAQSYDVYFGPSGGGCNTLLTSTPSTSARYPTLTAGREYESRIVASGPGCPQTFTSRCVKWRAGGGCNLLPPTLTDPIANASGVSSPVVFRWTRVEFADLYTIFVGVNGATPTEIGSTTDTSFTTSVPTGSAIWYVVASSRTCPNTARSANGSFQSCNPPETPRAGVEGAPISGTLYSVVWDAVPGATRYEVDEAQNEAFTGPTTQSTTDTRMPFSHRTVGSPAVYFYRVRAFGNCTNIASANSRTVRVVILPPVRTSSLNVPVGSRQKIKHSVFIPGEPDGSYNYIATTDKPWFTIVPPGTGVLPPNGITIEVEVDPTDLPNGTITGTVILSLLPVSSGNVVSHAATAKSQPVSVNLVTPVKPGDVSSPTADTLIIPSVGHLAGINSLWRSDIRILNLAGAKARYQLDFITTGAEDVKQTIIEVDTNGTTALDDIVHNWYGFGEVGDSANGILQIRPLNSGGQTPSSVRTGEAPVLHDPNAISSQLTTAASSRTYSTSANGTLGQFIPAVQFGNFIGKSGVLSLQQIAQSADYRTNVGVVEAAGKPVSVLLSIFNSSGSKLMDVPLDLKAGEQKQLNGFLATNGITLDDGRIEVRVTDGDGKVTAYASMVDNKSIDPLLVSAVQVGALSSERYVLPGVADLNTGSASWRTDMRVFNGGSSPQTATLMFHPQNNASAPLAATVTVNPGEVKVLNNVLQSLFATRDIGGAIHVLTAGSSQLTVTGRTYNQTPNGTFGQFIPAVTASDAADRTSRALNILQVEDSVRYRTNIGIAEVTGNPVTVEVTVNLPDSKVTPKVEIPLAANEFRQFAIIRELGLQNIYNARVTVRVISGNGAVTAYGSVIDMVTSDPTYVPAQ